MLWLDFLGLISCVCSYCRRAWVISTNADAMASSSLHSFVQRRGFAVSLRTVINTAQKVFRKQDLVVHLHRRNKSQSSNSILLRVSLSICYQSNFC
jgi:hypothetical protein